MAHVYRWHWPANGVRAAYAVDHACNVRSSSRDRHRGVRSMQITIINLRALCRAAAQATETDSATSGARACEHNFVF